MYLHCTTKHNRKFVRPILLKLQLEINETFLMSINSLILTTRLSFLKDSGAIHPSVPMPPDFAVKDAFPCGSLRHKPKSDIRTLTPLTVIDSKMFCGFKSRCTEINTCTQKLILDHKGQKHIIVSNHNQWLKCTLKSSLTNSKGMKM